MHKKVPNFTDTNGAETVGVQNGSQIYGAGDFSTFKGAPPPPSSRPNLPSGSI